MASTQGDDGCRYCDRPHPADFLCPPAKRMLDALHSRGQRFDMPTIEFDEPLPGTAAMLGADTVLMHQIVVKAAVLPVAGTPRPALVITGVDAEGRPMPSWIYAGYIRDIQRARQLVCDMADLAIRRARQAAREAGLPVAGLRWVDHLAACPLCWGAVTRGCCCWLAHLCAAGREVYDREAAAR